MKKTIVVLMVAALSVTGLFASPVTESNQNEWVPQTCNIRITGTFDSKEININVSLEADNCAKAAGELLKAALSKK